MKKILIVDDQIEMRELVEATLRSEDYQVLQAENGEQAVEIANSEKPDLIIMDVTMPGMGGIEATRIIKNTPETEKCTVIMLTARFEEKVKKEGLTAGASDYFAKPFSPLQLLQKVEQILKTE